MAYINNKLSALIKKYPHRFLFCCCALLFVTAGMFVFYTKEQRRQQMVINELEREKTWMEILSNDKLAREYIKETVLDVMFFVMVLGVGKKIAAIPPIRRTLDKTHHRWVGWVSKKNRKGNIPLYKRVLEKIRNFLDGSMRL